MPYTWLSEEHAYIFRITHIDNVRWILRHGLHCRNSNEADPNFVTIGLTDLIERRHRHGVPIAPGGTLSDYVPFYFTPFSPMAYNIYTGQRGVNKVRRRDIVVLVASLRDLADAGVPFVFTDRHAVLDYAEFFGSKELAHLDQIDWHNLRKRDFQRDNANPDKMDRYQAEALIHNHLPIERLRLIACWRGEEVERVQAWAAEAGVDVRVRAAPAIPSVHF